VRLLLLIGVLVFEFVLIWVVRHFGWLESVNIWTQIAVVCIALSPLVLGVLILVRKRFKLSSMLIAIALFAVFLGAAMRPVYEARQARWPAKMLHDSGAVTSRNAINYDVDVEVPSFNFSEPVKEELPGWVVRLLGDYVGFPPAKEIFGVYVENDVQLDEVENVADRLPNLQAIQLVGGISPQSLERHADLLSSKWLQFGNFGEGELDLRWFKGQKNSARIAFWRCPNAPGLVMEIEDARLEVLSLCCFVRFALILIGEDSAVHLFWKN